MNLRYWRDKAGLTQKQLEVLSGVAQSSISEIEANKTTSPNIKTVKKLAHALGIPTYKLLEENSQEQ